MKKALLWITILVMVISTVGVFSLAGCKTTAAATETTAAAAETTVAAADANAATTMAAVAKSADVKDSYRLVMIPILVQSWFDLVYKASVTAADIMGASLGTKITIDYQAPKEADVVVQNQMLEQAIASKPDGIAIDCNDVATSLPILKEAQKQGIPVVLFVAKTPEGETIPYVSNDFYLQGTETAETLVKAIGGKGEVAIMGGVPTNTAHAERMQAAKDVLAKYPDIKLVAEGFDYDDIGKGQTEAARIISANPNLNGFIVCDAAGPIGLGLAIQEADKVGKIKYIGVDDLPQLQELMRQGVLDLSIATRPKAIGQWSVVSLMMENFGITPPLWFNTGVGYLTPDMVKNGDFPGF